MAYHEFQIGGPEGIYTLKQYHRARVAARMFEEAGPHGTWAQMSEDIGASDQEYFAAVLARMCDLHRLDPGTLRSVYGAFGREGIRALAKTLPGYDWSPHHAQLAALDKAAGLAVPEHWDGRRAVAKAVKEAEVAA